MHAQKSKLRKQTKPSGNKLKRSRAVLIIPTLGDRPDLLEATLESINNQGYLCPDIILVCPKDSNVRKRIKGPNIYFVDDKRLGISAALNEGFGQIKPWHEFGGWMGDDDLLAPGSLNVTINALDNNPDAVLAFGYCNYIDDDGEVIFTSKAGSLAPWLMTWGPNLVPLPGLLYRLSAVNKAGLFDTSHKYAMDLDMMLRLRKMGRFINTKKVVGSFRWHSESTTVANRDASLNEAERIKRQYLNKSLRIISPVWEKPVKIATQLAVRSVNRKINRRAKG